MDNAPKKSVKPMKSPQNPSKESLWEQAWQRYCDNGNGMTDADIKIIKKENYVIPADFRKNCHPPK